MKTRLGHIIGCMTEEAGEVSQAIGKIMRFGLNDSKYVDGTTNFEDLKTEVHHVVAAYQMLCVEIGEDPDINLETIAGKKEKVEDYIQYSKSVGHLETKESE